MSNFQDYEADEKALQKIKEDLSIRREKQAKESWIKNVMRIHPEKTREETEALYSKLFIDAGVCEHCGRNITSGSCSNCTNKEYNDFKNNSINVNQGQFPID
jgi:hypothetical protein